MSVNVYRKYIDIINENSNEINQLDEGMLDNLKQKVVSTLQKILTPEDIAQMREIAERVLGKPSSEFKLSDLKNGNAEKLAKALGATPNSIQKVKEGYEHDTLYHPNATLVDKIISQTSLWGGLAGIAASFFGTVPNWVLIPSVLAVMFLSQIGTSKKDHAVTQG